MAETQQTVADYYHQQLLGIQDPADACVLLASIFMDERLNTTVKFHICFAYMAIVLEKSETEREQAWSIVQKIFTGNLRTHGNS
jgi:hypothetical protein